MTKDSLFAAPAGGQSRGDLSRGDRSRDTEAAEAVWAARAVQATWAARTVEERLRPIAALRADLGERPGEAVAALGLGSEAEEGPGPERAAARGEALSAQVVPLADACAFLQRSAANLLAPRRPGGEGRPGWLAGVELEVVREPLGVVLVIAPANYPLFLPGVQVIQALVAGNAVLLKPGSGGSGAARWLAARLEAGGLPRGVLTLLPENPVHARRAVALGVDKVVLTGSADTGAELLAALAPKLTPATLELSGNDALIALAGADPQTVVDALAFGLRLNRSATCIAPRRALIHRSLYERVERGLARELAAWEEGGGEPEEGAEGLSPRPLPREAEEEHRADRLVDAALCAGGHLLRAEPGDAAGAAFPAATLPGPRPRVVVGAPRDAELRAAALFTPVATLDPVADADEAVRRANESPYGLGASVFGDPAEARAVAGRLKAGVVTVNDLIVPTADPRLPFSGRGLSGFGVTRGAEGLLEMTAPKAVAVRRLPGFLTRRFARPHRHFEPDLPEDEALFEAWLAVAHGGSPGRRLAALPGLVRALVARARAGRLIQQRCREAAASSTSPTSKTSESFQSYQSSQSELR